MDIYTRSICTQSCVHTCIYTGLANGGVVAAVSNPAVSRELLLQILDWKNEGSTMNDVLARLRQRTVPPGYSFHTRVPGTGTYTCTCV